MYRSRVHNYVMAQDLTILGIPASILKAHISACSAVFISVLPDVICMVWNAGFSQECFHFRELTWTVKSLKCEGAALLTSCYQQSNYNLSSTS